MAEAGQPSLLQSRQRGVLWRMVRYFAGKALSLFIVCVLSVFLIIIIANYGGYIDQMVKGEIDQAVGLAFRYQLNDLPLEQRNEIIEQTRQQMYEAAGVNEPFLNRTARWLWRGLTLDFGLPLGGSSFLPTPQAQGGSIRDILLDRLPATLELFGSANLLIFVTSISAGMFLSRRYDSWLDKLVKALSPLSAIPAWFYGVLMGMLLVALGKRVPILVMLFTAIFLAGFFQTAYVWRSFFLLYAEEDYVEMAKAKGLSERIVRRDYLMRPALPTLLTYFALMLIGLWMGSIVLETVFGWEGIGKLFLMGITFNDTPLIVSIVVVYAYMLAVTIFLLDVSYALVDPRVRIGNGSQSDAAANKRGGTGNLFRRGRRFSPPEQAAGSGLSLGESARDFFSLWGNRLGDSIRSLWRTLREINRIPPARRSLLFILFLFGLAVYTVVSIPYDLAISLWRGDGQIFVYYPREASPEWVNLFREDKLPPNLILDSAEGGGQKVEEIISDTTKITTITYPIPFPYAHPPQDLALYIKADYAEKQPLVFLYWDTPDGRRIKLADTTLKRVDVFNISQSPEVQKRLKTLKPEQALFAAPGDPDGAVLQGEYALVVEAFLFEPEADLDAEFVMRGQVFGLAGTDIKRRDIMVELLWGLPIVLAFGLLGAVMTNVLSMLIAAAGAWYGGWLDGLLQRITELNMALPAFPISLMVFVMYSKSIWVILVVTVALGIFGSGVKTYRATFLQIKEAMYIEAARAYGASDARIVLRYMLPRIVPVLAPQVIVAIPSFVFLEASLAFLGVSDPVFPTWGKLLVETFFVTRGTNIAFDPANMLYYTHFYTGVLVPALLLILLALSFNTLGTYLEKVLNPRLKSE